MTLRLVACDLDGTLLRSDGTLDERTLAALASVERAGAMVVFCTARPPRWMAALARASGQRGVAVCANGAVVWDLGKESVLESWPLAPNLAARIVRSVNAALPDGAWAAERISGFAHERAYTPRWPTPRDTPVAPIEALLDEPAVKLLFCHQHLHANELLERARELVGHLAGLSHSNSADRLLEISAPGISKAGTLERICDEHGIRREQVIAFGDAPNDLPMLAWAGHAEPVKPGETLRGRF
jgi:Cof subfamily protein (haloacid dehalogenase superfamily)